MPHHSLCKQTLGIILAAGCGRRMGCLKQTLPWGNTANATTIIAHIFDTLQPHTTAGLALVVGDHQSSIIRALPKRAFAIVQSKTTAQQYESICGGLTHFINESNANYALLQPADHPHIPAALIETLFQQIAKTNQSAAIIPTFQNKGGHPVLIPRTIAKKILTWAQSLDPANSPKNFRGLKTFWHQNPHLSHRLETDEPTITIDLDTPQDYQQARSGPPQRQQCQPQVPREKK